MSYFQAVFGRSLHIRALHPYPARATYKVGKLRKPILSQEIAIHWLLQRIGE